MSADNLIFGFFIVLAIAMLVTGKGGWGARKCWSRVDQVRENCALISVQANDHYGRLMAYGDDSKAREAWGEEGKRDGAAKGQG